MKHTILVIIMGIILVFVIGFLSYALIGGKALVL